MERVWTNVWRALQLEGCHPLCVRVHYTVCIRRIGLHSVFGLPVAGIMCIGPEPQAGTASAMEPLKGKRVAVVGSGISGLGAAWLLHRQGAACMRETNDPAMLQAGSMQGPKTWPAADARGLPDALQERRRGDAV